MSYSNPVRLSSSNRSNGSCWTNTAPARLMRLYCMASLKDARKIVRPHNGHFNVILAAARAKFLDTS